MEAGARAHSPSQLILMLYSDEVVDDLNGVVGGQAGFDCLTKCDLLGEESTSSLSAPQSTYIHKILLHKM